MMTTAVPAGGSRALQHDYYLFFEGKNKIQSELFYQE
jgi:hypothetical protein